MSADGVRAEAIKKPVDVTWRDLTFTIQPPDGWILDFSHWAERSYITQSLEVMLGTEQYEAFRAVKPAPTIAEVHALINSVMSEFGVSQGESSASTA